MFGLKLLTGSPPDVDPRLRQLPSNPLPQRLSARDTNAWREPTPPTSDSYLTFWTGNQIPGPFMHITPHAAYIAVRSQDDVQPQLRGGNFGSVLGQLGSAQLVTNWRLMWQSLQAKYGS